MTLREVTSFAPFHTYSHHSQKETESEVGTYFSSSVLTILLPIHVSINI